MMLIGSQIGEKYCIEKVVYETGKHSVYSACDIERNKPVTLKKYLFDKNENDVILKHSILNYYGLLHRINHPCIVPKLIDIIQIEDGFVCITEKFDGRPLSGILKDTGAQDEKNVINWAKQICNGLNYLHTRVHISYRDMKPENIFLNSNSEVLLLAEYEAVKNNLHAFSKSISDCCQGTLGYAAPEQYGNNNTVDPRTDIYGLGATLYHLVTGHHPAEPPYEMYPIRYWNPQLSGTLEYIILKCTRLSPDARYQSCAELLYDLDHIDSLNSSCLQRIKVFLKRTAIKFRGRRKR